MNADFWKVAPVLMEALLMGTAAAKTVRYPARAEPPLPRLKAHPRAPWLAHRPACASHVGDRHLSGDESRDANVANGSTRAGGDLRERSFGPPQLLASAYWCCRELAVPANCRPWRRAAIWRPGHSTC